MANTPVSTGVDVSGGGSASDGGLDFANLIPMILGKFVAGLEGAVVIIAGYFVIRLIRNKLRKIELAHDQQRNAINLLEKITSGFIIVISVTLALKIVGLDMTLLVSVAILGLSYGLQDIIKNYVAGILILFKAPFKIGDVVKIRDFTGKVTKMDFQSTTLTTFDNRHITIYNSDVMTQSIVNFSNNTMRRLDIDVTLGYETDIPKALQVFTSILNGHDKILNKPAHSIVFKKYSEYGPVFTLKFWVQRPCNILAIRTEIANNITQAFDEQNIHEPHYKGVEVESETNLSILAEERKNRIKNFYSQAFFTQAAAQPGVQPAAATQPGAVIITPEGTLPAEGQPPAEGQVTIEQVLPDQPDDTDEPEA